MDTTAPPTLFVPAPRAGEVLRPRLETPPPPPPAEVPVHVRAAAAAWAAVLLLCASSAVLGLALVLGTWVLAGVGVVLGLAGLVLACTCRLMTAPAGDEALRDFWPLGPHCPLLAPDR